MLSIPCTWLPSLMAARCRRPAMTPENCVEATALALRKSVLQADLDGVLATLPAFAAEFWSTPGIDPASLGPRIV